MMVRRIFLSITDQSINQTQTRGDIPDAGNLGIGLELVLDRSGVDVVGTVNALGDSGVLVVVVGNDVGLGVLDVGAVDLEGQGGGSGDLFSGEWRHVGSSLVGLGR